MTVDNRNIFARIMRTAATIESNEVKATIVSFLFVFTLMAAYYIMRPVRDAMASDWSDAEISFLWTLNFFISLGLVALYGYAVSRVRFKHLVPGVYCFFAASFIFFYFGTWLISDRTLIDKSFYVWVSVFALFHTTIFWSYMADTFNKEQAKRLFATIATGMFAGSQVGPLITVLFVDMLGSDKLTLIAAVMLLIPVPMILYLARLKVTELHNENVQADLSAAKIGGNPLAGFKYFFADPYLLAIGVFILLYTMISSFIYFEQAHVLEPYDRDTRAQILGSISFLGNTLQYVLAFFVTGRIVKKFGIGPTLAAMPVLVIIGMTILAFTPVITVLLALQLVRQAGNYAITQPARHMLFTEVDKETRFKTKPVTDIAVYRGGDMITAWFFTGLTEGLGLAFTVVGLIGAGIAAVWATTGLYLGKVYDRRKPQTTVAVAENTLRAH